ncbi:CotO family spore coat protein [Bacillus xiapuensis]|uniref:CotO family spore coat protein n=1 Tax=Bacillus xiapuensis TaxID=2014075 RepID=UPI0012FDD75E|nr:CotO family spore coat protein [Bacillus xiapuensis]
MEKKKKTREPLMYIQQPSFTSPEANMQQSYRGNSAKAEEEKKKKKKAKEHQPKEKWDLDEEEETLKRKAEQKQQPSDSVKPAEQKAEQTDEPVYPSWMNIRPVKSFQEMTLDEKLSHLSRQFIPFPCEFLCRGETYRGILRELTENEIKVKTFKEDTVTISRGELEHIQMIGPR